MTVAAFTPVVTAMPLPVQQDEESQELVLKIGNKYTHLKDVGEWVQGTPIKKLDTSKVYVIDFWSTQAPLCKRAVPYLNGLFQDLGEKGLVVVGITQDSEKSVRNYMKDKTSSMTFPITARKDDAQGAAEGEVWKQIARHTKLFPFDVVVNRAGQICYLGSCLEPEFERILRLCLDDRFDPELNKRAEPMIGAARRAAKIRNYREATRIYDQVVDLSPRHFTDIALEHWRMISEQVLDAPAAKAYVRKLIERVSSDEPTLIYIGNYLALNTEIKNRDLEAATIVAGLLRKKGATSADSLGCIAAAQAANGDFEAAAETQYDAWMTAPPSTKAAFKRSLDNYRAGRLRPTSESPAANAAAKTDGDKPKTAPESKPGTDKDTQSK